MSIPVLKELYSEIMRLSSAGSSLAYGDFGLKKIIPSLKKMGENAAVFSKLASMAEDLVSNPEDSEEKLLELLALLNAVLYTQGDWEVKGDIQGIELIPNDCTTSLGYRKLSSIIDSLTARGPGRYSRIAEGYNEGTFNTKDKRLTLPLIKGLEDSYAELPEFILEKIIPIYGQVMVHPLKSSLDLKGGKGDGRKLRAVHKLRGSQEMDLYNLAVTEGSPDVKLAAIEILNIEKAPDSLFESLLKDKRKEIRDAAEAVLESRKTGILDRLARIFQKPLL